MKRETDLYQKLITDENLRRAILEVNKTHRWNPRHRPNKTVARIEKDVDGYVAALRRIINKGFVPHPPAIKRRYDKSAMKWRDISEPRLWPDQYVHHALVQVLACSPGWDSCGTATAQRFTGYTYRIGCRRH